jgi:uncharacterized membrane protein YedE/YeeE
MRALFSAACGVVFGVGLGVSGMTNPAKVLAFLDFFGRFDPTLALAMAAALALSAPAFAFAARRERPWLGGAFAIPTRRDFDARLLGGAALFGVGWGLVGLCPGPALANLSRGSSEIAIFVAALVAGVVLYRALFGRGPER